MSKTELPIVEIYVSPELAELLQPGSSLTMRVDRQQPVGKGVLLVGTGSTALAESRALMPTVELGPDEIVLAGSATVPLSVADSVLDAGSVFPSVPEISEQSESVDPVPVELESAKSESVESVAVEPVPAAPSPGKSKFGRRGPQLLGVEETPLEVVVKPGAVADVPVKAAPQILSTEEFYVHLKAADAAEPPEMKDGKRLSREAAVKVFSTSTLGQSVWILNMTKGQLVVSDIGLRMRFGDAVNIGGIPASRLKNSVDLFEALSRGLVKIVPPDEAYSATAKTDRRLRRKFDHSSLKTYDNADDVFDEIENSDFEDDDPPPRRAASRRRRDDDFYDDDDAPPRRRTGHLEDEDLVRSSVPAPKRFRKMRGTDVTEDEPSEYDLIYSDVEQRERELKSSDDERQDVEDVLSDEGMPVARSRKKRSATWEPVSRVDY